MAAVTVTVAPAPDAPARPDEFGRLRIGPLDVWPPVVLAPMAGVTNAPFRTICRAHGAGLYVSEMITARALVEGNDKTRRLARFAPGESPRSMQLYGIDGPTVSRAVRLLVDRDEVDHIDLNFGCPARKVTRLGGGAALPLRLDLFREIVSAAVEAAGVVPVTVKMRLGVDDESLTYLDAGRIAEAEGVVAVALHARTAAQLYSGSADWDAVARLRDAVRSVPVLGNGDIWEGADALAMMRRTGCDGVVIGRGCLGRPWLFGDMAALFDGRDPGPVPLLGQVAAAMADHARLHVGFFGDDAIRDFRKHTSWYLKGYPVGGSTRRRFQMVSGLDELEDLCGALDPQVAMLESGRRAVRGHHGGPQKVSLPEGWRDGTRKGPLPAGAESVVSGG